MFKTIGSISGSSFGTKMTSSVRSKRAVEWPMAITGPPRDWISWMVATFLSKSSSSGITTNVGTSGLMRANGPCLSSEAG